MAILASSLTVVACTDVSSEELRPQSSQSNAHLQKPRRGKTPLAKDCGRFGPRTLTALDEKTASLESHVALWPVGGQILRAGATSAVEPYARSTIKVVILAALLKEKGGIDGLSSIDSQNASLAIQESSNEAARSLYESLSIEVGGSRLAAYALADLLRRSGDMRTDVPVEVPKGLPPSFISSYGATTWPVGDQVKFMGALEGRRVVDRQSTRYILKLMGGVVPEGGSTWGLGTLESEFKARFKAGWGDNPNGQYLARQLGVISIPDSTTQVSVAVVSSGSSQDEAYRRVTDVSQLVAESLEASCE